MGIEPTIFRKYILWYAKRMRYPCASRPTTSISLKRKRWRGISMVRRGEAGPGVQRRRYATCHNIPRPNPALPSTLGQRTSVVGRVRPFCQSRLAERLLPADGRTSGAELGRIPVINPDSGPFCPKLGAYPARERVLDLNQVKIGTRSRRAKYWRQFDSIWGLT